MIGDHLGGCDPVQIDDLRHTLDALNYTIEGDKLVVVGTSPHPAIEVATRTYIDGLTPRLISLQKLLPKLPLTIDVRIQATRDDDGRPVYLAAGARFELAEDRVRNLLMGQQLYGDESLAIRELYQNAVDATRHAAARLQYLAQQGGPSTYQGEVTLTQDITADGQEFVECHDNGVGMGIEEITSAFAQLGMRSADLPEFVAELADFAAADPPVTLWTNSRFGIGALSYFMLADRVDITTSRLQRNGTIGHTLQVMISGPGLCFRITDTGPSQQAGTTVRLWLREPGSVSVIGVLNKYLYVAPVRVVATMPQTGGRVVWQPDTLGADCVPDVAHRVWWVPSLGSVLSDGLQPDKSERVRGAYVDLTGTHAPQLSVDRSRIIDYDADYVKDCKLASVPTLLATAKRNQLERICDMLLGYGSDDADVKDAVANGLQNYVGVIAGELMGRRVDLVRSGCMKRYRYRTVEDSTSNWLASVACQSAIPGPQDDSDDELDPSSWGQLVRPRPSDTVLLNWEELFKALDADHDSNEWPLAALGLSAAELGRPVTDVKARYEQLGIRFPQWRDDLPWDDSVVEILTMNTNWPQIIPEMAVAQVGRHLGLSAHHVATILDAWGVPHESIEWFGDRQPTSIEGMLFAQNPRLFISSDSDQFVCRGTKPGVRDLKFIAEYLGRGLRQVAQMARDYGLDAPMPLVDSVDDVHAPLMGVDHRFGLLLRVALSKRPLADIVKLANDLGGGFDPSPQLAVAPDFGWFTPPVNDGPLHRAAVLVARQSSQASIDELTAALEWAGFMLVGPPLDEMDAVDVSLAVDDSDDEVRSVWDVAKPMNPYLVMAQAVRRQISGAQALRRYLRLGYQIDHPELVWDVPPQELMLASPEGGSLNLWTKFYSPGATVVAARVWQAKFETGLRYDDLLASYARLGLNAQDPRVVFPVRRPY
ncbi:MAG: hypothetical protein FWD80_05400, partial [Propionibacteriaceae bacterium]|nr:hypothetical protein [Propionibacteriaceae bacterium]